jgi:hypothetical protein
LKRSLASVLLGLALLAAILLPKAPVRAGWNSLTGVLPEYASIGNVSFAPDSQTVVFIADVDQEDIEELYSVPIGGGTPVKLNPTLVKDGEVISARISPDGSRVIYVADQEIDEKRELYSVPIGG